MMDKRNIAIRPCCLYLRPMIDSVCMRWQGGGWGEKLNALFYMQTAPLIRHGLIGSGMPPTIK